MLAGLIFATEDADDRPGVLAATLPFGGLTLIEFQARLLMAAGASQIVLVVARMTPELLGAINRIGRRDVTIDTVRTAVEAAEKLHPLAQLLVMADGLVTSGEVVDQLAGEGGDMLLVADHADAVQGLERVGAASVWAGLARLDRRHVAQVAAMPRDYDFQSTLLRVAAQAGAAELRLGPHRAAHGVVRDSRTLATRGRAVLAALISAPVRWADRWLLAPIARLALPAMVARSVPTLAVGGASLLAAFGGFAALHLRWPVVGLAATIVAMAGLSIGAVLAWVRDEDRLVRLQRGGALAVAAIAALLLGELGLLAGDGGASVVAALALLVAAALVERAAGAAPSRRWWASPLAFPLVMLPGAAAGQPLVALGLAAGYAALTLAAAIEGFREKAD